MSSEQGGRHVAGDSDLGLREATMEGTMNSYCERMKLCSRYCVSTCRGRAKLCSAHCLSTSSIVNGIGIVASLDKCIKLVF